MRRAAAAAALGLLAAPMAAGAQVAPQGPAAAYDPAQPTAPPPRAEAPPPQADAPAAPRRDALDCADVRRAPAGGWTVLAPVEVPSPRGPLRLSPGQEIAPGEFVGGLQLAAVLQARCPP